MNENKKPNSLKFYKTYEFVSRDLKLKGIEKDIFSVILANCEFSMNKFCEISLTEFQERTAASRPSVLKAINDLKEKEFILIQKVNHKNSYKINVDESKETLLVKNLYQLRNFTTEGKETLPKVVKKFNHFVNKEERSKEETNNKNSLDIKDIDDEDFEL